ncbi:MAG: MCE family protein [Sedimentisphaerales bacterium]|nr:MCE family protein [Sedimentisphaerales bacterium]
MTDKSRNLLVGAFVVIGLGALGWLIFKFGDMPLLVSQYHSRSVKIYFPAAPGIKQDAPVLFRGYPVGQVAEVRPPALLADLVNSQEEYYQVIVIVAIGMDYQIPSEAVPKVYRRGLGGSYIEFQLPQTPQSGRLIADGDTLKGVLAESSDFLSEGTQQKLDELITSMNSIVGKLESQLTPIPPEVADANPDQVQANVTTVFMRLDKALKNINDLIGDQQAQQDFKQGLANFAALAERLNLVANQAEQLANDASALVSRSGQTMEKIDQTVGRIDTSMQQTALRIQNAADELAGTLSQTRDLIAGVAKGEGTLGKLTHDPRLYDALTDTAENLNKALTELRNLLAEWKESGAKVKLK